MDNKYFNKFKGNPGLSDNAISEVVLSRKLPDDYLNFIKLHNGGEGFIGKEYVQIFPLEQLDNINKDYGVDEIVPGIFLFGSNGGGEALAFDFRDDKIKYILIPFIFSYADIILLGNTLEGFFDRIFTKGYFV